MNLIGQKKQALASVLLLLAIERYQTQRPSDVVPPSKMVAVQCIFFVLSIFAIQISLRNCPILPVLTEFPGFLFFPVGCLSHCGLPIYGVFSRHDGFFLAN